MTAKWVSVVHLALVLALVAAPIVGQQESSTAPASTESSVNATTPSASGANSSEPSTSSASPLGPSSTSPGAPSSSSTEAPTTTAAAATTTEGDASAKSTTAGAARNTSGRAFDFESDTNETTVEKGSLQDLSLDDIDMSMFMTPEPVNETMEETSMPSSTGASAPSGSAPTATSPESPSMPVAVCVEPKGTFAIGERWTRGCDENCTCGADGRSLCEPRCSLPLIRRGSRALDAECFERPSQDPCCAVMVCTHDHDTETEPVEECQFKNQTLQRGESVKDGCESVCTCGEAGTVTCKPRCPPVTNTTSDRCVAVPDTVDPCCTVVRCDVTLTDHEVVEPVSEEAAGMEGRVKLTSVVALNSTAARVETEVPLPPAAMLETSVDGSQWIAAPRRQGSVLAGLKAGTTVWVRAVVANMPSNTLQVALPMRQEPTEDSKMTPAPEVVCTYKGSKYSLGETFQDGCEATCMCSDTGVKCSDFECPSHTMMMLEPHCVQWDTDPPGFEPSPGHCCPDAVRCVHNGSCLFEGERFAHGASIPQRLTGCEKRCVCDAGNVTCVEACPPTPHTPPPELPCPPHRAELDHVPGDGCCLHWTCPAPHSTHDYAATSVPGGFPHLPVSGQPEEVVVQTLEPLDATSVRVVFSVPPVFVGLHGRIELRYTDDKNNHDPSTWKPQVLAPPQDLLATPTLEFTLGDLKPDTEYRVKITVLLRDLQNSPSSPILAVHTPPVATSTLPPVVPVSPELEAAEVNASWAMLTWRRFSDFEMQLIDGVQLRYKPLEDKVYQATPLIHRAVTSYTIENLKPSTTYEVRIFFIPFPGQASELQSDSTFQFTTKEPEDMYKFDVHMEVHHIKSTSIEVNWTGVPYPEDKYVNIYRAIYQSDSGKEDFSTFSVAKRDSTPSILIKDLAPGTRYRLWLEIYLTNGKIKKSNVQDFNTRPGSVDPVGSSHQGKLESSAAPVREAGDYYSPLVAVAILAALAIMATLILLLMLMKRRSQTKAAITAGRKSQSAYDNPSYKTCEDQQPAANGNGSAAPATAAAAATPKAAAAATPNAHVPAAAPAPAPQPA